MERGLGIHVPGMFYHVLARGNERRKIFRNPADCERFGDLPGEMSGRFGVAVWAYVLMKNHYHLILRPDEARLSVATQWLGVAYNVWHKRRHNRSGHLCQDRFKAFAVEEADYLERLICYVHRNPLRAGPVKRLAKYPWRSYVAFGYGRKCPKWLARIEVLRFYGGRGDRLRRALQSYSDEDPHLWEDLRQVIFPGSESGLARLWRRALVRSVRHFRERQRKTSMARAEPNPSNARRADLCGMEGGPPHPDQDRTLLRGRVHKRRQRPGSRRGASGAQSPTADESETTLKPGRPPPSQLPCS